jgi:hypothetical protein
MDVLSEVLRVVKLNGALFFNAEFCPLVPQHIPVDCHGTLPFS